MISAGSAGPGGPSMVSATPVEARVSADGTWTLVAHIYMDGRQVHSALIPVAQTYKRYNGTTGLS